MLSQAREFSVQTSGCLIPSLFSQKFGIKKPQAVAGTIAVNASAPLTGLFVARNSLKTTGVVGADFSILTILTFGGLAQIEPSVVVAATIFVVYVVRRPLAGFERPRDVSRLVDFPKQFNLAMPAAIKRSRDFAAKLRVCLWASKNRYFPTQYSRLWRIAQQTGKVAKQVSCVCSIHPVTLC